MKCDLIKIDELEKIIEVYRILKEESKRHRKTLSKYDLIKIDGRLKTQAIAENVCCGFLHRFFRW